jgi:hypothetical protein
MIDADGAILFSRPTRRLGYSCTHIRLDCRRGGVHLDRFAPRRELQLRVR